MSTRGIDVRQTSDRIVFRASLKDDAGDKVVSGTTELRLLRVEDDGTLDVYDWTTNDFVEAGSGTPDDETTMTHRQRRDSTGADVDTGIWTAVLSTLTNFAAGQVYIAQVTNSGATPESQEREFQFGSFQGDGDANATQLAGQTVSASAGVTFPASLASPTNITAASGITLADASITAAKIATDAISAAALSAAAVAKIEAALLNEGDGQALIDAIVQAIDAADIDTDILPALIRDAILNRVLSGNHDTAGTTGLLLQNLDAAISSRAAPGADGDTLKTLSDQLDAVASQSSVDDLPTNSELATALAGGTVQLHPDYDAAKTAAQPGEEMDLVDSPNATARTAIGTTLEAMILDEGDATALLAAIAAKVETFLLNDGDASATLGAIGTAVRTELATELARIDAAVTSRQATFTSSTGVTLPSTVAAPGNQMDLVNAPNATAITAITSGLATSAALTALQKIVEADIYIDKAETPWEWVLMEKGTGAPGVGTELLRKQLFDVDGGNVTSTDTVIGRQVHTT